MGATFTSQRGITLLNVNLKRWIPRIVLIAAVAALMVFLVMKKPWAKGDVPITFQTVPVVKGTIAAQVTANGTLSAVKTVTVGAQVGGKIVNIYVDFNDHVTKGQVVAKLDELVLSSEVEQAAANVQAAQAALNKAQVAIVDGERQWKRQKGLEDQKLVAAMTVEGYEVTYDTAKASLVAAKAGVAQAVANLDQAKLNLSYATIYSPVTGVVLSRAVDVGQTVNAGLSAPTLFTIAEDLAKMQIDTSVAEGDVGRIADKMKAQFTVDAFPGKTFEGIVRQVRNSPTVVSGVVAYDAVIDVDNKDYMLRPGMTASTTFVLDQVTDVIKIPNAALRFKLSRDQMQAIFASFGGRGSGGHHRGSGGPGGSGGSADGSGHEPKFKTGADGKPDYGDKKPVWKLGADGKPKMVLIKPGLSDGSSTQMTEGDLAPGDQLITEVSGLPTQTHKVGAF
jgi:HlyD family secretion protein